MDFLIAAVAGLAYGALWGLLKYLILWRPIFTGKKELTAKTLYPTQIISTFISIVVLLLIFFLRKLWPYSFEVTLICAAISLSISSKLPSLHNARKIKNYDKSTESHQKTQ